MKRKTLHICLFCFFSQLYVSSSLAQNVVLEKKSTWKYLDNGSDQGSLWKEVLFDDNGWKSGLAILGYGDTKTYATYVNSGCGAVVPTPGCSKKFITTYFRKELVVTNVAQYDNFAINVLRDDGVIVYVNGVEVLRNNMPAGTVLYTTKASALGDQSTYVKYTVPFSLFKEGSNVIAVEIHQQSESSSDVSFDMEIVGNFPTNKTIIAKKADWKYLDDGSNQGTLWKEILFNDNGWKNGPAILGYGDTKTYATYVNSGCGTVTPTPSCSKKFITTYFRKTIDIADITSFENFTFNLLRDDGAVVYVNGVEVFRSNMADGTVLYTTKASALGNQTTYYKYTVLASAFKQGSNSVAVEIHQDSETSSDITFDLEVIANYPVRTNPVLSRGPYLNMGTQQGVTVRWRTGNAANSKVEIGTQFGFYNTLTVEDATLTKEHIMSIKGLQADTKYWYRVSSGGVILQGGEQNFFTTAPGASVSRKMTFAAFGDCGRQSSTNQNASYTAYRTFLLSNNIAAPDAWLLMGDNAYNSGTDGEYTSNFFNIYGDQVLKNHIVFPAPGNHDYANSSSNKSKRTVPYYQNFSMPQSGECGGLASGDPAFYSWNWGNVHFVSLDSYGMSGSSALLSDTTIGKSPQMDWLRADLAANTRKWVIAYWHHPPYTMGSHNSDTESDLVAIREKTIRVLERLGVDMIICGHSHVYERTKLINGHYGNEKTYVPATYELNASTGKYDGSVNSCPYTTNSGAPNKGVVYVVAGSAGSVLGSQSSFPHEAMRGFSYKETGFFFFEVEGNRLNAKFITTDNAVRDQFTIVKDVNKTTSINTTVGQPVQLSASWPGTYIWSDNNKMASSIMYTPQTAGVVTVTVKDKAASTCMMDNFIINAKAPIVLKNITSLTNLDTVITALPANAKALTTNTELKEEVKEETLPLAGKKQFQDTVSVTRQQKFEVIILSQTYNQAVFQVTAPIDADLLVQAVAINGKVIEQKKVKVNKGVNTLPVNIQSNLITIVTLLHSNKLLYTTKIMPR